MKKNNNNFIFLIPLFILLVFFILPVKAADKGCCEIKNIPDNGQIFYENKTETECDGYNSSTKQGIFSEDKIVGPDGKSCAEKPEAKEAILGPSKVTPPILSVYIPGFNKFSEVTCEDPDTPCAIPWLAEYINALFNYSLGIIAVLAVIVIMIGGVMWLTAAGNRERIGEALSFIKGGVLGIIIAVCAFTLLYIVNPNLTVLSPINVTYIEKEDLPDGIDLSKSAEENNMSEQELSNLKSENPYQDACGNVAKCSQYGTTQPSALQLVKVAPEHTLKGTVYLKKEVYEAFKKALTCVNKDKIMFKINEGWRNAATQVRYKKLYGSGAAAPCCSNHGSGVAMDLARADGGGKMSWEYNESSGLKRCMNQNGLYAKLTSNPNEPWHWSPSGR